MKRPTMIKTLCLAAVALLSVTVRVDGEECAHVSAMQIAHEREIDASLKTTDARA